MIDGLVFAPAVLIGADLIGLVDTESGGTRLRLRLDSGERAYVESIDGATTVATPARIEDVIISEEMWLLTGAFGELAVPPYPGIEMLDRGFAPRTSPVVERVLVAPDATVTVWIDTNPSAEKADDGGRGSVRLVGGGGAGVELHGGEDEDSVVQLFAGGDLPMRMLEVVGLLGAGPPPDSGRSTVVRVLVARPGDGAAMIVGGTLSWIDDGDIATVRVVHSVASDDVGGRVEGRTRSRRDVALELLAYLIAEEAS